MGAHFLRQIFLRQITILWQKLFFTPKHFYAKVFVKTCWRKMVIWRKKVWR